MLKLGGFGLGSNATISVAQRYVEERCEEGVRCPCCGQYVKVYRRKINSTMARALLYIYKYFEHPDANEWLHVADYLVKVKKDSTIAGGDASKLRLWGLIEPLPSKRQDGSNRVGYYRITDLGKKFAEGKVKVSSAVYVYNQQVMGYDEQTVNIEQALGSKFNYAELMA